MEQVDQKKSLSQQLHDKASKISIGYDCLGIASGTNRKCQTEGHRLFQNRLFCHDGRVGFRRCYFLVVHLQSFGRVIEQDCRISSSAGGQLADSAWLGNVCHHRFDRLDESRVYVFDFVRSVAVGARNAL